MPSNNGDFKVVKFIDGGGYKIEFNIHEDRIDVEVESSSLEDVKKAIELIESGKVCIDL